MQKYVKRDESTVFESKKKTFLNRLNTRRYFRNNAQQRIV